jgi:hypothetical protein
MDEKRDGPPEYLGDSYTCPWCGIPAQQHWETLYRETNSVHRPFTPSEVKFTHCHVCDAESLWYKQQLIVPSGQTAPLPHPDLPEPLRNDYIEARDIAQRSPRGAAALLRLVIERLCPLAGGEGDSLFNCIGNLVDKGLRSEVQEMLDTARVIGNDAVHGGILDPEDDARVVDTLFWLVNEVTDEMISRPKRIKAEYARLNARQIEAIKRRDKSGQEPSAS